MRAIGSGGFGAVYEATRLDSPMRVALKVLHTDVAGDEVEQKRFRREANVMMQLRHRHVAEVIEAGETPEGAPYLALELLRGHSLRDELRRHGPRSAAWVGQVAEQILQALELAHAHGVVHRDLKPHNVFLCADQPMSPFVKVLDFGIAKLIGAGAQAHTMLTATGAVLGTPHYMAPEQVHGESVGPAADLYALGLIMAEALSGRRIMQGSDSLAVLLAQASPQPIPLPVEVTRSPLGRMVERAAQKNAVQRYPSAAAMLAELNAALGPVTASPSQVVAPPTASTLSLAPPAAPLPRPAAPSPARRTRPLLVGVAAFLLMVVGGLAGVAAWLITDAGPRASSTGERGPRWKGSLATLKPITIAEVLRSRGFAVGEVRSTVTGEQDHREVVHVVPIDDTCAVFLSVHGQTRLANRTEERLVAGRRSGTVYRREGNSILGAACATSDAKALLDAVLAARD